MFQVCSKVIHVIYVYIYVCVYIYMYLFFFRFFSIISYYKILSIILCALQLVLVVYLFYIWKCVSKCTVSKRPQVCTLEDTWLFLSLIPMPRAWVLRSDRAWVLSAETPPSWGGLPFPTSLCKLPVFPLTRLCFSPQHRALCDIIL